MHFWSVVHHPQATGEHRLVQAALCQAATSAGMACSAHPCCKNESQREKATSTEWHCQRSQHLLLLVCKASPEPQISRDQGPALPRSKASQALRPFPLRPKLSFISIYILASTLGAKSGKTLL